MFTRERLTRWTEALRKNPEQQRKSRLFTNGGMCCLGKLCEVEGLEPSIDGRIDFPGENGGWGAANLKGDLADAFGSPDGHFTKVKMPNLDKYDTAAAANDRGISWTEIADHFDRYYPCSDE